MGEPPGGGTIWGGQIVQQRVRGGDDHGSCRSSRSYWGVRDPVNGDHCKFPISSLIIHFNITNISKSPYNAQVRAIHAALCRQPPAVIAVPEGDMELLAGRNPEYRAPLLSVVQAVTLVNVRLEDVVRVTTV